MFTNLYAITYQHSTVHIVTVRYQNNKPILHLTHFVKPTITVQYLFLLYSIKCLFKNKKCSQSANGQHSHCCYWPTNTLTSVRYTNSTTFVSPLHSSSSFCCCCVEHFDISKICCFISDEVPGSFTHLCKRFVRKCQMIRLWNTVRLFLFLVWPPANDLPAPNIHRPISYLPSYCRLKRVTVYGRY